MRQNPYLFGAGELLEPLLMLSMLVLPVAPPCLADFRLELEREARVGPVAGAVFIFWPERCPLPGEVLGTWVMGLAAGLAEVRPAVASVAELEPSRERGVWAEALAMLVANTAARMRNFFINLKKEKLRKGLPLLTASGP